MAEEILFSTKIDVNYVEAEKELRALQKRIDTLTQKRTVLIEMQIQKADQMQAIQTQLEAERARLADMQGVNSWKYSTAQIDAQKEKVKQLQSEFNKLQTSVNGYEDKINQTNIELDQSVAKAKDMSANMLGSDNADNTGKVADNIKKTDKGLGAAGKSVQKFNHRVAGLVKRVLIFSVITMALRSLRNWLKSIITTNEEAKQQLAQLKGALLTLVQPLVDVILPVLTKILSVLATIVRYMATAMSALFGKSLAQSASAAEALHKQTSGASDDLGEANKDAKKLKKTLASFDELNVIEDNDSDSGAGVSAGVSAGDASFDFAGTISRELEDIATLSALGMIGLGLILCISKVAIPAGLALIMAGALTLYGRLKTNPNALKDLLEGPLGKVVMIIGGAMMVIGLILIIAGQLPLGVACLTMGVAGLVAPAVLNENAIVGKVKKPLSVIMGIVGTAMLALGIILICTGVGIPTGIALIAAGLASVVTTVSLNRTAIINWINEAIETIHRIWDAFTNWLTSGFENLGRNAQETIEDIRGFFIKIIANIQQKWQDFKNWIQTTIINPITNAWNTATQAIQGFFDRLGAGIKRTFASAVNGVITGVEWAINKIVDGLNGFISGINWVIQKAGKLAKQNWGGIPYIGYVSLPRVPALAQGTVVPPNKQFLAMLGDNKNEPEVVSPLSTMQEALAEVLKNQPKNDIVLQLSGKEVARVVWSEEEKRYKQTGQYRPAYV